MLAAGLTDEAFGLVGGAVILAAVAALVLWLFVEQGRRRRLLDGPLRPALDGALLTVGALAVVDNVVFHWLLGFHRFKDGWEGSIVAEVLLVLLGVAMVVVAWRGLRARGLVGARPRGDA